MDVTTYAAAKKYTADSLIGLGALKGANCTVSKIEELNDGASVTFMWTATDGTTQRSTMKVSNGVSIVGVTMNSDNTISCTLSDGSVVKSSGAIKVEPNKINYTTSKDSTIKSVGGALDKLFENGGGVLEEKLDPNVSMGSVKASYPVGTSIEEIIRDMLTEKIAPAVSIVINPSATLYDIVNDSVSSLTINATITKKTNDITKVEYFVNDVLVHTNTSATNGGSFPYVYNAVINKTTTVKVVVTDTEGMSSVATKKIEFVGRSYYGYIEPEVEVTESVIKTLQNNVLQNTKALTYSGITCAYHRIVYCYDKAFGELTTIIDPINNFSYNSSFEKKTVVVDNVEKLCYILIQPTGADDVTIRFS